MKYITKTFNNGPALTALSHLARNSFVFPEEGPIKPFEITTFEHDRIGGFGEDSLWVCQTDVPEYKVYIGSNVHTDGLQFKLVVEGGSVYHLNESWGLADETGEVMWLDMEPFDNEITIASLTPQDCDLIAAALSVNKKPYLAATGNSPEHRAAQQIYNRGADNWNRDIDDACVTLRNEFARRVQLITNPVWPSISMLITQRHLAKAMAVPATVSGEDSPS